jgi:hypothetical protein
MRPLGVHMAALFHARLARVVTWFVTFWFVTFCI